MLYYATLWYECSVILCYGMMLSNGTDYHDIVIRCYDNGVNAVLWYRLS
jgi:hypothetical protein